MRTEKLSNPEGINVRRLVVIVGVSVILLSAWILYTMGNSSQIVYGYVQTGYEVGKESGVRKSLLVKLDNGSLVTVRCPVNTPFLKDLKVSVLETKTKLFGFKRYDFTEYLSHPAIGRVTNQ